MLPADLQQQYLDVFVDFACGSAQRHPLLIGLYEIADNALFERALRNISKGVSRIQNMLNVDLPDDFHDILMAALEDTLCDKVGRPKGFFSQKENARYIMGGTFSKSMKRAVLRILSYRLGYEAFVPLIKSADDIDWLLEINRRPMDLLACVNDDALKSYILQQLT